MLPAILDISGMEFVTIELQCFSVQEDEPARPAQPPAQPAQPAPSASATVPALPSAASKQEPHMEPAKNAQIQ